MRLIHCKKCGTMIATDETAIERMYDEIKEERMLAAKSKNSKEAAVHLQNAKQMLKIVNQIQHRNAQLEDRKVTCQQELSVLVHYLRDNGLITYETLDELRKIARERAEKMNKEDEKQIDLLYKSYSNYTSNMTKADPTCKCAIAKY